MTRGDVFQYEVRRGDTLYGIARRFDVSVRELMRWNDITDPTKLQAGRVIAVSHPQLSCVNNSEVCYISLSNDGYNVSYISRDMARTWIAAGRCVEVPYVSEDELRTLQATSRWIEIPLEGAGYAFNSESSRGSFFDRTNTVLGAGGFLYSGLQYATVRPDGSWLGNNGRYYRPGWGGNQYTGGRSSAIRTAGNYNVASRFVGAFSIGFVITDIAVSGEIRPSHWINGGMAVLALTGKGAAVTMSWFLIDTGTMGVNYLLGNQRGGLGNMLDDSNWGQRRTIKF